MKIYGDVISPFVRMCLVTAHEVGVGDKLQLVKTHMKPNEPHLALQKLSPTAKIPVLETDHHHAIYDSRVIMEYLAHVAGDKSLFPDDGVKHFRGLTLLALANGLGDAAVALRYEQFARPAEFQWPEMKQRHLQRIHAATAELETLWQKDLQTVTAGCIAVACVLSYIDLRHGDTNWRDGHPRLTEFHSMFENRPSMKAWPLN